MRRGWALLLVIMLLGLCLPWAAMAEEVASAPLSRASAPRNGMVRVYLSSMGSPTSLDVTIAGNYTADGAQDVALSTGETVNIRFDTSSGQITMTAGGSSYAMGQELALRRHETSGSNGLRIAQARKSANLYPGDLRLIAQKSGSSWRLYPIVHVYMEDYLCGVVPYEMGNSAHVEALKAQAVAARTYTLNKMNQRASSLYDVVDTTNDQVYYGNSDSTANCTTAVLATKGIVLMNGSSLTSTWYTASNGGQTESALNCWGSTGYSYLTVKDDPFDLMNAASSVKSATVYAEYASAAQPSALKALLEAKVRDAVGSAVIQRIEAITPHTPKFSAPSRLYTKMDFDLTVSVSGTARRVTVTCDIFSELESALGLSINAAKNELWSVSGSGSTFTIQARRYGHGVGMSQRGAMRMGALGYTYDQILGFYYENSRRVQYTFTHTILSGVGNEIIEKEEPPAEITPEASGQATVSLPGASDVTALRTGEDSASALITYLPNGAIVTPLARGTAWTLVRFGSLTGYVRTTALRFTGDVPTVSDEAATAVSQWATVVCSGTLNLRQEPSLSAKIVTTIPAGEVLVVFSTGGGFAQVQYGAHTGYASLDFLRLSSAYPGLQTESSTQATTTDSVRLRAEASTAAAIITTLNAGTAVTVTANDGSWCRVEVGGMSGYVMAAYLSFSGEIPEAPPLPSETPGLGDDEVEAVISTTAEAAMLYDAPREDATVLCALMRGESVVVTQRGETWCAVRTALLTGYVRTAELRFPADSGSDTLLGYARVTTASGSLNLRSQPKAGSSILTTIPRLTQLPVYARQGDWVQVRYNGLTGWVMRTFLTMEGGAELPEITASAYALVTTPSGSLNLRETPSARGRVLTTIPPATRIPILARQDGWSQTTYSGLTGWVMEEFLTVEAVETPAPTPADTPEPSEEPADGLPEEPSEEPATPGDLATASPTATPVLSPTPAPTATPAPEAASVRTGGGWLNLRAQPTSTADVLARIPEYAQVQVIAWGDSWTQIVYEGVSGYAMTRYLSAATDAGAESVDAWVQTPSGALNLRGLPSTGGRVLRQIPQGAQVKLLHRADDWCQVVYDGMTGYVMTTFLRFDNAETPDVPAAPPTNPPVEPDAPEAPPANPPEGTAPTATPVPAQRTAWVTTPSGTLNFRADASTASGIIATLKPGTQVTVLESRADGWSRIRVDGTEGYVQSKFLTEDVPPATGDDDFGDTGDTRYVNTPSGSLNLRENPVSDARILAAIPKGAAVRVLEAGTSWCRVRYDGVTGYVVTRYLTGKAEITAPPAPPTNPPDAGQGDTSTSTQAPTETPAPTAIYDVTLHSAEGWAAAVSADMDRAALYAWCDETAEVLAVLHPGDAVPLLKIGDEWCLAEMDGQQGYILTTALALWQEASP